jgi:cryptochrome
MAPLVRSAAGEPARGCRVGVHWFRNGLRFHDNPSWRDACLSSRRCLLPLVVLGNEGGGFGGASATSPWSSCLSQSPGVRPGIVRASFYLESLADLNARLAERGSGLVVVLTSRPVPETVAAVAAACLEFAREQAPEDAAGDDAVAILYEQDAAQPVRTRDAEVWDAVADAAASAEAAAGAGGPLLGVRRYETQTLHPLERYAARCRGGTAPPTFGGFQKVFGAMGPVPPQVDAAETVPPLLPSLVLERIADILNAEEEGPGAGGASPLRTVVKVGEIPTLEELGYSQVQIRDLRASQRERPDDHLRGGETQALDRLRRMMARTTWVATFEKPKTRPNALTFDTTGLSPCTFVLHPVARGR